MGKQRGKQNVTAFGETGNITVTIAGLTAVKESVLKGLAQELSSIFFSLNLVGDHKIVTVPRTIHGTTATQGITITGIEKSSVVLAYQPKGNDSRGIYHLQVGLEKVQEVFRTLKDYFASTRNSPTATVSDLDAVDLSKEGEVTVQTALESVTTKPTKEPEVYYTSDPEWIATFVLFLVELAEKQVGKVVSNDQVKDLIIEHTHYETGFGIGPVMHLLKSRGHLVVVDGRPDHFTVVESVDFVPIKKHKPRQKRAVPSASVPVVKKTIRKRSQSKKTYLGDAEWVESLMRDMTALVDEKKGTITHSDTLNLIMKKTGHKKMFGAVGSVLQGLIVKDRIRRHRVGDSGEISYQVIYQPKPDTVEKAVAEIERVRAETSKVFEGFANYRLPKWAEGIFKNLSLLDRILRCLSDQEVPTAIVIKAIARDHGVCDSQCSILIGYLCGKGYLIKSKRGYYKLGPTGYNQLGLPFPKALLLATAPLAVTPQKQADLVMQTPEADTTSVVTLPATEVLPPVAVKQTAVEMVSGMSGEEILQGLAKLAKEGSAEVALIAQLKPVIARKKDRKAELQAMLDQRPDIDALATKRLLAMITEL